MSFIASESRAIAHHLHLLALGPGHPLLARSYAKDDARLRRSAGSERAPANSGDAPALEAALVAEAEPEADAAWFELRWSSGEGEAMADHARRLAEEASAIPDGSLLGTAPVQVLASPTAGRFLLSTPSPPRVVAPPRAPAIAVVLAALAQRLSPALSVADLEPADAACLRFHAAGTVLARALGGVEALEPWLPAATAWLRPAPSDGPAWERSLQRIASACLDQPPAEVERIASGLAGGWVPRLARAWRRGFFLPADIDVEQLLATLD